MTLWKWLGVPMPGTTTSLQTVPQHILIWGGSASTGQFATQFAVESGLSVIAITSAKTKPLVERLGAQHVIARDGKSNDDILNEIRAIVGDDLTLAIDMVGNDTAAYCIKALSTTKPSILAPLAFLKAGEEIPTNVTVADVEMKRFVIEQGNEKYGAMLNELISGGKLSIPEILVLEGGLEKIQEGLDMQKKGDLAGRKLIVRI
jgi:NADPH:quinone reductase-like Zn-dependent oxidoreductase